MKFKRSRYYIFGDDGVIWYYNKQAKWIHYYNRDYGYNTSRWTFKRPFGLSTNENIMRLVNANRIEIVEYTRKEVDERIFLENI